MNIQTFISVQLSDCSGNCLILGMTPKMSGQNRPNSSSTSRVCLMLPISASCTPKSLLFCISIYLTKLFIIIYLVLFCYFSTNHSPMWLKCNLAERSTCDQRSNLCRPLFLVINLSFCLQFLFKSRNVLKMLDLARSLI